MKWWPHCKQGKVDFCVKRLACSLALARVRRCWCGMQRVRGGWAEGEKSARKLWSSLSTTQRQSRGPAWESPWRSTQTDMCEKRQTNGNSWKPTTPIIIRIPRAPFRAYVGVSFVRYQICLLWSRKLIMPTSKRLGFFFFFHVRRANNGFAPLPPLPRRQTLCPTYDDNPCLPPQRFLFAARVCHSSRPYLPEEVARSLSHTLPPPRLFLGKYSVKRNPCPGASVLLSTLGFF